MVLGFVFGYLDVDGFECDLFLFACFLDCLEYGVVPVFGIVDECDCFGRVSFDVVGD